MWMFTSILAFLLTLSQSLAQPGMVKTTTLETPNASDTRHWPNVPFGYAFDQNPQYQMVFFASFAKGNVTMIHRTQEILAREVAKLTKLPSHFQGPNIVNLTGTGGMPWIGCRPVHETELGIPWRNSVVEDFMRTFSGLVGLNGFQEFDFNLSIHMERFFACCRLWLRYDGMSEGFTKSSVDLKGIEVKDASGIGRAGFVLPVLA